MKSFAQRILLWSLICKINNNQLLCGWERPSWSPPVPGLTTLLSHAWEMLNTEFWWKTYEKDKVKRPFCLHQLLDTGPAGVGICMHSLPSQPFQPALNSSWLQVHIPNTVFSLEPLTPTANCLLHKSISLQPAGTTDLTYWFPQHAPTPSPPSSLSQ